MQPSRDGNCAPLLQIFVDPKTRLPRLEDHDLPWQSFQNGLRNAGFHIQPLDAFRPREFQETDPPLVLLAAGRNRNALASFCQPLL